jgi:hypothetical protein
LLIIATDEKFCGSGDAETPGSAKLMTLRCSFGLCFRHQVAWKTVLLLVIPSAVKDPGLQFQTDTGMLRGVCLRCSQRKGKRPLHDKLGFFRMLLLVNGTEFAICV